MAAISGASPLLRVGAVTRLSRPLEPPESAQPSARPTSSKRRRRRRPIVAATDYMNVVPDQIAPWLPGRLVTLGTDGFGRSDNRQQLRRFFEINAEAIAAAALSRLARDGKFDAARAQQAIADLGLDPESADPSRL